MSIKHLLRTLAVAAPVTLAIGSFSVVAMEGTASAAGTTQSATIDATNGGGNSNVATGKPFSSGQLVTVNVPANTANGGTSELAANQGYTIWECSDLNGPGGTVGLPTNISECDSNTANGTTGTTNSDGSVSYGGYEVYALPDTVAAGLGGLGENSSHTPVCNLGSPCVLAVLTDTGNFQDPTGLAFTQPFIIKANGNDSGANPGDGTPEAPLVIGLPLVGLAAIGGTLFFRRRQASKSTSVTIS